MFEVEIKAGRRFNFAKFPQFKQVGVRVYRAKNLTKKEARRLWFRALIRGYRPCMYDAKWARASNYRQKYMNDHTDSAFTCVYCGRSVPRNSVVIDHVVPIYAAKHSALARGYMKLKRYTGVNDERNLIHCCKDCNAVKGRSNSIIWVIRAKLGQKHIYWESRKLIIFCSIVFIIALAAILLFPTITTIVKAF